MLPDCRPAQQCLTLQPHGLCSPPGSSVNWILQAKYWSGLLFPSQAYPGIELASPTWAGSSLPLCHLGNPEWSHAKCPHASSDIQRTMVAAWFNRNGTVGWLKPTKFSLLRKRLRKNIGSHTGLKPKTHIKAGRYVSPWESERNRHRKGKMREAAMRPRFVAFGGPSHSPYWAHWCHGDGLTPTSLSLFLFHLIWEGFCSLQPINPD